jgi:hypothetical protein
VQANDNLILRLAFSKHERTSAQTLPIGAVWNHTELFRTARRYERNDMEIQWLL